MFHKNRMQLVILEDFLSCGDFRGLDGTVFDPISDQWQWSLRLKSSAT